MIEDIKKAVQHAESSNQKIAMFHLQVLKNARELRDLNPAGFCKEIGVPATYRTEFTKMIALARLMEEQGVTLEPVD